MKQAKALIEPSPLKPHTHLASAPINEIIGKVNEAIAVLIKRQAKYSEVQTVALLKYFQVPYRKINGSVDMQEFTKPEFIQTANFALTCKLFKVLNQENRNNPPQFQTQFKYQATPGNNDTAVCQVMKRRSWWVKGKV